MEKVYKGKGSCAESSRLCWCSVGFLLALEVVVVVFNVGMFASRNIFFVFVCGCLFFFFTCVEAFCTATSLAVYINYHDAKSV